MSIPGPSSAGPSFADDVDHPDIHVITRGRGKVLLYDGFQYYFHVEYKNTNCVWRCKNFKTSKCTGSLTITKDQSKVEHTKKHSINCLPDKNENIVSKIVGASLETAASSVEDTVPAIFKRTVASMRDSGLHLVKKLPTYNKYQCIAYRRRRKMAQVKKMSYSEVQEVEVPTAFDDFKLADYSDGNERILVFALDEGREILKVGKVFLSDGTFKSCPKPFTQLYVFFCDLGSTENTNNLIPVVYALLPNKLKETYIILLELIKSQIPEWEPTKFITDYEQAAITAIKTVFPQIEHHGCYFHFQDKLKKKAKQLMILKKKEKNSNQNLNKLVGLCTVLPLLPETKIEEGWDYIVAESKLLGKNKNLDKFLMYIERFWMPKRATWSNFGERHRTTNSCEGWNGQFNKSFKGKPKTMSHFLKRLKEDAAFTFVKTLSTEPHRKRSQSVIDRNTYIHDVQMQLVNGDINVKLFLEKLRR